MVRLSKNISFGLCYLILCLMVGEVHPFTVVPMYNNFPNWAYAFFVTDIEGKLLPGVKYFKTSSADLSHRYWAICERDRITCGNQTETKEELRKVGEVMLKDLMNNNLREFPSDTIQLHRVSYYFQNDSILSTNVLMYERAITR
jgi:hypothetical protein